jgi:hypothetical protein
MEQREWREEWTDSRFEVQDPGFEVVCFGELCTPVESPLEQSVDGEGRVG